MQFCEWARNRGMHVSNLRRGDLDKAVDRYYSERLLGDLHAFISDAIAKGLVTVNTSAAHDGAAV